MRAMTFLKGEKYKYRISFSYPYLIKTSIIAKKAKDGSMEPI